METSDLSEIEEYKPGKGVDEVAEKYGIEKDKIIEVSSNENPLGPPPKVVENLKENLDLVSKYPKKIQERLKTELSKYLSVSEKNIALGAGADGIFDNINKCFLEKEDGILTPSPGFSYYGLSAKSLRKKERHYELKKEQDFDISSSEILNTYNGEKIVYITTPNNPTGTTLKKEDVKHISKNIEGILIIDEAYQEFSNTESNINLSLKEDNIIVVRTFSKSFGLAGLRIGYAIGPENIISLYRKVSPPFPTSTLSYKAAISALNDEKYLKKSIALAKWGRKYIRKNLRIKTFPSQANFVLAQVGDANKICKKLESKGIIVRNTSSFGLPECIRIGVGKKEDTKKVVKKINKTIDR